MNTANKEWRKYQKESSSESSTSDSASSNLLVSNSSSLLSVEIPTIAPNAPAQHKSSTLIREAEAKITEYEHLMANTSDKDLNVMLQLKKNIEKKNEGSLKKRVLLKYLIQESIHQSFRKPLNYLIKYMNVLNMALLPRYPNTHNALRHRYPANVKIAAVSRSEMNPHIDEHYCLASVKMVREFTSTFANHSIIISQDDKAKIGLGIPVVSRTFQSLQSFNEPVTVSNHDFPHGAKQKLVPSVYLIINPEDTNESLRQGQLSIYVRPEYFVRTSSMSHMRDLIDITKNDNYTQIFKCEGFLKSIWVLLVDGGPDENPRHLKNIIEYCCFFCELDLDYLSIHTHAPSQSAYNPVERSMCTLGKT